MTFYSALHCANERDMRNKLTVVFIVQDDFLVNVCTYSACSFNTTQQPI